MDFVDRAEEKKRFSRFLNLREGALACIYGRRRIGKSEAAPVCRQIQAHRLASFRCRRSTTGSSIC